MHYGFGISALEKSEYITRISRLVGQWGWRKLWPELSHGDKMVEVLIETQDVKLPTHGVGSLRRRVAKAMQHISTHVSRLHLNIKDVNGEKGGRDKVCTVRLTLVDGGEVVVVDKGEKVRKAMFRALRRSRLLIRRELKRRRQQRRQRALLPMTSNDNLSLAS